MESESEHPPNNHSSPPNPAPPPPTNPVPPPSINPAPPPAPPPQLMTHPMATLLQVPLDCRQVHQTYATARCHIPMSPLLSPTRNGYQGPAQQTLPDEDGEDEVDPLAAVVTGKWG